MYAHASAASGSVSRTDLSGLKRPLLTDVTGEGEPIVLMPGTLTGWASWIAHAERLSASRKVIRMQLRNVELAQAGDPIPGSYGVQTEVDGMLAAADELGLERFDLAGWSLGGLVALAFALDYPQRVKTLTLVEPAAVWVLRAAGYAEASFAAEEAADRQAAGTDISIDDLKAFLVRAGIGGPDTDFESHPRWSLMVRNRQALSVTASIWDHMDSLDRLRSCDIPMLVVRGTASTATDRAIAETIASTAPRATLLDLPGDHSCHIQEIDRFIMALERHLET